MKQYILYLCILIFGFGLLNAQQDDIPVDSIYILRQLSRDDIKYTSKERLTFAQRSYELAKMTKIDSTILWSNIRLATTHSDVNNYDTYFIKYQKSLKLAKHINDKKAIVYCTTSIGSYYNYIGIKDSAYFYLNESLKYVHLYDYKYDLYINLAYLQEDYKLYIKSEQNIIKALEYLSQKTETEYILESKWSIFNTLGGLCRKQGDYIKAINYYKKAILISKKLKNGDLYNIYTLNNIGEVYRKKKDYKKAIEFYNKAINYENLFNEDPSFYALLIENIAMVKFSMGSLNNLEIITQLKSVYHTSDSLEGNYDNKSIRLAASIDMSKVYLKMKEKDSAYKYLKEAYYLSKVIGENNYLLEAVLLLADLKEGDAGKAYLKEYITLNDSITNQERNMRNKFARIEYESDQLEANNETLIKEKKWLYYIVTGVLSISLLVYIILMQRSKNRKLKFTKAQQKANEDIYSLILAQQHQLEEGRLQERHRVSEELHDGVLSKLFGTRLGLSFLELKGNTEDVKKFNNYLEQINTIEKDVRHLSHNLKTSDLNAENGFNTILKTLLDEQTELHNIQYNTTNTALVNWKTVNDQIKVNLYRIIQEALYNIIKHAEAKTINLDFNPTENNLELIIRDDGKGFNPKKVKKGIGLKNIASRIKKLNGIFFVDSNLDKGTTIQVSIPL